VPSLETTFCGLRLPTPFVNGSGTLDALVSGTLGLSAFVTKTVTLHPREGNPPPRIAETPAGMVNSIGLANPGLERFCEHDLPRLAELGIPIIASVGGWSPGEYAAAVARIGTDPAVTAIELNVSCPNVESGCISIGTDPRETRSLVERCRAETDVPVLAKLSPSVTEIEPIATAAAEGGADGLVLINTVRGIAIDRATLRPLLGGGGGGLSGPAVKPVALHAVFHAYAATGLPIIGMGGVEGGADASEFLAAGASLVGIGTALFRDPGTVERAAIELLGELERRGASRPEDLLAAAHTSTSTSSRA
jgi:dihydroorotate dehydrogenase (NAD+) catalytic subunit